MKEGSVTGNWSMYAMRTPSSSQKQGNFSVHSFYLFIYFFSMLFQLTKSKQTAEHIIQRFTCIVSIWNKEELQ
jgi:hypothetical protein